MNKVLLNILGIIIWNIYECAIRHGLVSRIMPETSYQNKVKNLKIKKSNATFNKMNNLIVKWYVPSSIDCILIVHKRCLCAKACCFDKILVLIVEWTHTMIKSILIEISLKMNRINR